MALNFLTRRLYESTPGGGSGGGDAGLSPAQINANRNRERLARINEIGNTADSRRSSQLQDTDGERTTGRFQNGEFDNTEQAREAAAEREDDEARQALEEQEERARLAEDEEQREARRLQEEGGEAPTGESTARSRPDAGAEEGDEKVIDGTRYYRTIVAGSERWLTMKELREGVSRGIATEETLQRAQDALRSATQTQPSPKPAEVEVPDEKDLENIILSANMGDEEASKKLASLIRQGLAGVARPTNVSQEVAQQIATQREVDRAEAATADLLGNDKVAPIFRMQLTAFANQFPKTRITEAYEKVAQQVRKDYAPMLVTGDGKAPVLPKSERKRQIVTPPRGAGRQPNRDDDNREVPVSEEIDAIARTRGQIRAHRIRRS